MAGIHYCEFMHISRQLTVIMVGRRATEDRCVELKMIDRLILGIKAWMIMCEQPFAELNGESLRLNLTLLNMYGHRQLDITWVQAFFISDLSLIRLWCYVRVYNYDV